MIVILDTNVYQQDYTLESQRMEVLLDFVRKTKGKIVLPKIVFDELIANYRRELDARIARANRAIEQLNGLLPEGRRSALSTIEPDSAVERYRSWVLAKIAVGEADLVPLKASYLNEVVERAISRRAPCTESGEEMRDALLWLTVRDIACETPEPVMFISYNTKQFTRNKTDLHPDLRAELAGLNADLDYLPSLESFTREHASHIAFITEAWLIAQIPPADLIEGSRGIIESYVEHIANDRKDTEESPTGYVNLLSGSLRVQEYFVYAMSDGSFRLDISYLGDVEVEYEFEREEETEYWEYDYEIDPITGQYEYQQVPRTHTETRARTRTVNPEFWLAINATVEDGKVTEWSAIDGWLK